MTQKQAAAKPVQEPSMALQAILAPIAHKPAKAARFSKFNLPQKRAFGKTVSPCRKCGRTAGVIRKYGLRYCRQCFREEAAKLGFRKYQ